MENKKPKPQLVQIQPQKSIALTVQRSDKKNDTGLCKFSVFSPQRQIRPAPTGAPNQTIQILQGQPNPTPSKLHFIHK